MNPATKRQKCIKSPRTYNLAAAEQHGKGDHLSAHESSRLALEHATKAFELAQAAHRESEKHAPK